MYGYIFLTENKLTGKKYIGQFASVKFDKKHLGNVPELISDVKNHGSDNFSVKMLRACESKPEYEAAYEAILAEYKALSDSNYYNCVKAEKTEEVIEEKSKKSRKKKKEIEE